MFTDECNDFLIGDDVGSVGVDVDADRFSHTDCVGELDFAFASQSCCDDVFGDMSRHVSGRSVHLGGILSAERTTTMSTPATVGIDNDFAACQAGITVRSPDDKPSGWVDVVFCLI